MAGGEPIRAPRLLTICLDQLGPTFGPSQKLQEKTKGEEEQNIRQNKEWENKKKVYSLKQSCISCLWNPIPKLMLSSNLKPSAIEIDYLYCSCSPPWGDPAPWHQVLIYFPPAISDESITRLGWRVSVHTTPNFVLGQNCHQPTEWTQIWDTPNALPFRQNYPPGKPRHPAKAVLHCSPAGPGADGGKCAIPRPAGSIVRRSHRAQRRRRLYRLYQMVGGKRY